MRIVLFGSGSPLSLVALAALSARHEIVGTVLPAGANLRSNALARASGRNGSVLRFDSSLDLRLRSMAPDLLCVATFPHRLTRAHLAAARLGGLNVHTSLLPRHRGPDPLFWTYFENDELTGVTIHEIADGMDAGDIVTQAAIPLRRGRPVTDLYAELSTLAGEKLLEAAELLEAGTASPRPQGTTGLSVDRRPAAGSFSIDFGEWDAERLWHFLSGIAERRSDLLPITHGPVLGCTIGSHDRKAGTIAREDGRLRVYCRDGFVDVARPSMKRRLRALGLRLRERWRRLY